MRSWNSPAPTGNENETTFAQGVVRKLKSELQFYDSTTVRVEQTTRGVRFHARQARGGGGSSTQNLFPFAVYQTAVPANLSGGDPDWIGMQVRWGMLTIRGRSLMGSFAGFFTGNGFQLVFFEGTGDQVLGWDDPATVGDNPWTNLAYANLDEDVTFDGAGGSQILLYPDSFGGTMLIAAWIVLDDYGLNANLHFRICSARTFPDPDPRVVPLALIYAYGSDPANLPAGYDGKVNSLYVNQFLPGTMSGYATMLQNPDDAATEPTGPSYYAGDWDDDDMRGWIVYPGDVVRVTYPYNANRTISSITVDGVDYNVDTEIVYAFFQCVADGAIYIEDSPSSGDPDNPVSDDSIWVLVSEIYANPAS